MQAYAKLFVATVLCTALGAVAGYSFHTSPVADAPACTASLRIGSGGADLAAKVVTPFDGTHEVATSWKRWPTVTDF